MFRRHFTVMVVPDAQALLRRFQIRGGQIAGGLLGLAVLIALAFSSPLLLLWGIHLTRELSEVRADRDHLVARSQQIEQSVSELRQQLAAAEKKTQRLLNVAGLAVTPPEKSGGKGAIVESALTPALRADQLKGEAEDLIDRASMMDRRLDSASGVLGSLREQNSHRPLIMPAHGLIGAGFGWRRDPFTGQRQFHRGLDICAPAGSAVVAPADGVVLSATQDGGYGNILTIGHGDGVTTRYGHLSAFKAKAGDRVRRGDVIAYVGNTGRSTGAHVHYEILEHGAAVNPADRIMDNDED